jgi:hypothetical protein
MNPHSLVELGGLGLWVAAFSTGLYMVLNDFGFGFLLIINVAIAFWAFGFLAFHRPDLSPVAGVAGIGLAIWAYVLVFTDPVWAIAGIVGGLLCIAGGVSGRYYAPQPQ